jgi:hypothetical protein
MISARHQGAPLTLTASTFVSLNLKLFVPPWQMAVKIQAIVKIMADLDKG